MHNGRKRENRPMPEATFKIVYERTEKSRQLDKDPCTTRSFELSALALESNDNKVRTCMYFVQPLLAKARPDDCP